MIAIAVVIIITIIILFIFIDPIGLMDHIEPTIPSIPMTTLTSSPSPVNNHVQSSSPAVSKSVTSAPALVNNIAVVDPVVPEDSDRVVLPSVNYMLYHKKAVKIFNRRMTDISIGSNQGIGEETCRLSLESLIEAVTGEHYKFISIRHPDIINPKTGHRLELDCYNEELSLALEYHGRQHFCQVKKWQTDEDYHNQVYRDSVKRQRCRELGIVLIEVPYIIENTRLMEFICIKMNELFLRL